ncbi:tetratricopeptide repeat protein [Primorskyibacter sp. S187A]|uniref:tetratricopeptide repeat protein n=1 Tax=Primorskyibacter sp. S187A TaxID=3415130 RepID=UPI003C7A9DED
MKHVLPFAFALLATPAISSTCPPVTSHSEEIDALYAQMLIAETETEAREYSNALWGYWTDAPDDTAQELLDQGMSQRAQYDLLGSLQTLDRLIDYCPDYAEGWNQRAFTRYLGGQFELALPDIDRALDIRPRHLGALTGKALTLVALDRKAEAILVLRQALALNPWLGERHMLPALEADEEEI